jgi:cell division septum initiation protein DivIVA
MATELPEGPPRSGAEATEEPRFATTLRGYDRQQVSEYVAAMNYRMRFFESRTEELESELRDARAQPGTTSRAPVGEDPFEAVSDRVTEVMRAFDQDVGRMRGEAEAEAERIVAETKVEAEREAQETQERRERTTAEIESMLTEARADADRIRVDAQAKAEEIRARAGRALDDARIRAETMLSELDAKRSSLIEEIRALHDRMLEAARDVAPVLEGSPTGDVVRIEDQQEDEAEAVRPGQ